MVFGLRIFVLSVEWWTLFELYLNMIPARALKSSVELTRRLILVLWWWSANTRIPTKYCLWLYTASMRARKLISTRHSAWYRRHGSDCSGSRCRGLCSSTATCASPPSCSYVAKELLFFIMPNVFS